MFNVDSLNLNEEYRLDVKVKYAPDYFISGILSISKNFINLKIFGETSIHNNSYLYQEFFDTLECTNYLNSEFRLYGVKLLNSHHARLSNDRGSFFEEYSIKELIYNNGYIFDDLKFSQLSFESKDIVKWIGNTKLQQQIIDDYYSHSSPNLDTTEITVDLGVMYLIIHYPINRYINSPEQKAGINFSPIVNIVMKEECTFEHLKQKYNELLNLFYLFIGYDINITQVLLYGNNNEKLSYYYKQQLDRENDNSLFINLGHNLQFNQLNIDNLPMSIFENYFKLSLYRKRFFIYFKKYKIFQAGEESFLGFFRILENIMFTDEILTDAIALELINNESRNDLKEFEIKKCKNKKLSKSIAYIKFITFFNNIDDELKEDIKYDKQDIRNIVKLRNDITHFNEYNISEEIIVEYSTFLEFLVTYSLLKLLNYSEQSFINNLRFYQKYHLIRKIKDDVN